MKENEIIQLAKDIGFSKAVFIDTNEISFDESYRQYCVQNLCGNYGANYSCPPYCGTYEKMRQRVLEYNKALVLQTEWEIDNFTEVEKLDSARNNHNAMMIKLIDLINGRNERGLMLGCSHCLVCRECSLKKRKPCLYPNVRYSCLSAYCINVKKLAEMCSMDYDYKEGKISFFGIYVLNN